MPRWADVFLIPFISLLLAAVLSALVIVAIGEDPIAAVKMMVNGALGSTYGWGYTLYYATNFIFTGLAVSVAFHARLFNIGGEGQAMLGGLGVAIACLYIPWPHWTMALVGAIVLSGLLGAAWALIPAYLQAKKAGSAIHIENAEGFIDWLSKVSDLYESDKGKSIRGMRILLSRGKWPKSRFF